jgi:hypothetical protein
MKKILNFKKKIWKNFSKIFQNFSQNVITKVVKRQVGVSCVPFTPNGNPIDIIPNTLFIIIPTLVGNTRLKT